MTKVKVCITKNCKKRCKVYEVNMEDEDEINFFRREVLFKDKKTFDKMEVFIVKDDVKLEKTK